MAEFETRPFEENEPNIHHLDEQMSGTYSVEGDENYGSTAAAVAADAVDDLEHGAAAAALEEQQVGTSAADGGEEKIDGGAGEQPPPRRTSLLEAVRSLKARVSSWGRLQRKVCWRRHNYQPLQAYSKAPSPPPYLSNANSYRPTGSS